MAVSDHKYNYPSRVAFEFDATDRPAYTQIADQISKKGYNVLSIQHEYGIFGGEAGEYLLDLVEAVKIPIVTTLHTVLQQPTPAQFKVMERLLQLSARVIVMSRTAINLLSKAHHLDHNKVDYIPHGIPNFAAADGTSSKLALGVYGPMLLTFGLLSPDKGIENVIQALPRLISVHKDLVYYVVGATHPHIKESSGESYRQKLEELTRELGVSENVRFVDEFVSLDRLVEFLSATDFYITPYLNPRQITSGTLAYSMGAGKVVISTPYEYAKEVLSEGRGILVPFADSTAISEAVLGALEKPEPHQEMRNRAKEYGSMMSWDRVATLYRTSFQKAIKESSVAPLLTETECNYSLPPIRLNHLECLTDDTGIYQHATFNVPNRREGYCVDDNARALLLMTLLETEGLSNADSLRKQSTYLSFVVDAYCEKSQKFRNFMTFSRDWLEDKGSEDSQARSLQALGVTAARSGDFGHAQLASKVFEASAPGMYTMTSPRSWAYTILGCVSYLSRYPESNVATTLLDSSSQKLVQLYAQCRTLDWPWFEPKLAYANARLPQALIVGGSYLGNEAMIRQGVNSLTWLLSNQTSAEGQFCPVGSKGADRTNIGTTQFDQQPIEVCGSISACLSAYAVTGSPTFLSQSIWCFQWFLGKNAVSTPVANILTGSCHDGLNSTGINQNQGAESTLSYLTSVAELKIALRGSNKIAAKETSHRS